MRSLYGAPLRTILGLFGIMIGIASVITMISIGEVAKAQSRKDFEALGTDIVTIKAPKHSRGEPTSWRTTIGLEDAFGLADAVPTISEAAPRIQAGGSLQHAGKTVGGGSVQGVSAAFASVNRLRMAEGRFVSDLDTGRYFAVVGSDVAADMRRLGSGAVVDEILEIGERLYTVIGVLEPAPETYALPFHLDANRSAFLPITTMRRIHPEAQIELIIARAATGVHYTDAARQILAYFSERSTDLQLEVVSAEQLLEQMESQLSLMTLLLGAVGSVSLIVGGIGVMNIMLISVTERRHEIGIRRALGARRGDIQRQFLIEALILTLGGGIAGVAAGTGGAYVICGFYEWDFFLSPLSIVVGVSVSTMAGLFFGFQPAYQASRLDPVAALQG